MTRSSSGSSDGHGEPASPPIQHALDWNGPDDTDNPRVSRDDSLRKRSDARLVECLRSRQNFSRFRRAASTVAIIGLAFVTALGAAIVGPGIPGIVEEFYVSEEVAILPLSLYTLGLAFGPLIAAPCCETFGRKIVFLVSSPLYALFTMGAGFSPTIASLVLCRFFAGLFAAPAIGNASATIIDYTAGKARGVTMAFYYSVPQLGAVFGPLGQSGT